MWGTATKVDSKHVHCTGCGGLPLKLIVITYTVLGVGELKLIVNTYTVLGVGDWN